jgi:hypothetical protein
MVAMPCSAVASTRDRDLAHPEVDRAHPLRLGQTEEGPGHQILRVAGGDVAACANEQVKLRRRIAGKVDRRRMGASQRRTGGV